MKPDTEMRSDVSRRLDLNTSANPSRNPLTISGTALNVARNTYGERETTHCVPTSSHTKMYARPICNSVAKRRNRENCMPLRNKEFFL